MVVPLVCDGRACQKHSACVVVGGIGVDGRNRDGDGNRGIAVGPSVVGLLTNIDIHSSRQLDLGLLCIS